MRAERQAGVAEWRGLPWSPAGVRETVGRPAYDRAVVSDDAGAVRPGGLGAARAGGGDGGRRQPDRRRADRAVRDRAGAARRTADPGADQRAVAGPEPRRAQPLATGDAAVDAGAAGRVAPAGRPPEPAPGDPRLPG